MNDKFQIEAHKLINARKLIFGMNKLNFNSGAIVVLSSKLFIPPCPY